jgi:dynactin complex subunit
MDRGYIRWSGPLGKSHNGIWYGIELDEEKGRHEGKGFFKTAPKHGTFVKPPNLRKVENENFDMQAFKKKIRTDNILQKKLTELEKKEDGGTKQSDTTAPADDETESWNQSQVGTVRDSVKTTTTMQVSETSGKTSIDPLYGKSSLIPDAKTKTPPMEKQ